MVAELCGPFALVGAVREIGAARVAPEYTLLSLRRNSTVCLLGFGTCLFHIRCCLLLDEHLHHFSQGVHLLLYGVVCNSSGGAG